MSEHREEHLDLCAGYALGSLSGEENTRLEQHLAGGCPTCEAALADFADATVLLAAAAPPARPSPELKSRVMAAVRETANADGRASDGVVDSVRPSAGETRKVVEMPRRPSFDFATWGWAAAAAALAIATAISWNTSVKLRSELEGNRQQLAQLEQRLQEERRWSEILNSGEARVAELSLTPDGLEAMRARATYDPRTRSAVIVVDNFRAPSGKDYELWALHASGVASLGVIKTDESGHGVLRLENVGDPAVLAGFAVSLEPAGGSPTPTAPTGPVVMAGKFAS